MKRSWGLGALGNCAAILVEAADHSSIHTMVRQLQTCLRLHSINASPVRPLSSIGIGLTHLARRIKEVSATLKPLVAVDLRSRLAGHNAFGSLDQCNDCGTNRTGYSGPRLHQQGEVLVNDRCCS